MVETNFKCAQTISNLSVLGNDFCLNAVTLIILAIVKPLVVCVESIKAVGEGVSISLFMATDCLGLVLVY